MKVLILGAGPAGTSCAISLLKAGCHDVTLIDRSKFPRSKVGETLHPGIEPLLKYLGVLNDLNQRNILRHSGIYNTKSGRSEFKAYNEQENWMGYQLYREDLDFTLLNKAIKLGANFYSEISPTRINIDKDKITSIETIDKVFKADLFIDATGNRAWLSQNYDISYIKYSKQRIAYYGYVENSAYKPVNPNLIWDRQGWTWIAQVKDNLTAWVRLDINKHIKIPHHWVPDELSEGKPVGRRKAADVTWKKAETCIKNNCYLIGDTAFTLDPGSSHGVLKAVMSGIKIAHLINQSTSYSKLSVLNHYNDWINRQFYHDLGNLQKLYREFEFNYPKQVQ